MNLSPLRVSVKLETVKGIEWTEECWVLQWTEIHPRSGKPVKRERDCLGCITREDALAEAKAYFGNAPYVIVD